MAGSRYRQEAKIAIFLGAAICAASANAAGLAGKWYGRLDAAPVITITQAASGYSASLDYSDILRSVQRPGDMHPFREAIHKEVAHFEVTGHTLRFTIRNTISWNGDTQYARDEYTLTIPDDVSQLAGTVRHIGINDGGVRVSVMPITLFPTDWNSRSAKPQ